MASLKHIVQRGMEHFNDVDDTPIGEIRLEGVEREGDAWLVRLSGLEPINNASSLGPTHHRLLESMRHRHYRTIKLDAQTLEFKGIVLEHADF